MTADKAEEGPARSVGLVAAGAACVAAAVRLAGAGLALVPQWLAVIVLVLGALELLSVGWNVARGKSWNERTLFDHVSDAFDWLPWP